MELPYFDFLLSELSKGDAELEASFGHHVHWGYWDDPRWICPDGEDYRRAADRLTEELFAQARLGDGQRILDVGCGFGGTIAALDAKLTGVSLTGLNIDPRQLDRARSLVTAAPGNTVDFIKGDACALPFADASFDRVLAVECVIHFASRETFLREAFRVLKPGGYLTLSDFVPSAAFRPLLRLGQAPWLNLGREFGPMHMDTTLAGYRDLARRAGLTLDVERDISRNTAPTYTYLKKISVAKFGRGLAARAQSAAVGAFFDYCRFIARPHMLGYWLLSLRKPDSP